MDVQVLGPDEFGTVSMPGPLGAEKLEPVVKGVTVGGTGVELLTGETDVDGETVALVNGPLVDIDADDGVEDDVSLPEDPDIAGDETPGMPVPVPVTVCVDAGEVGPVYVPLDSELDDAVPIVGLTGADVSEPVDTDSGDTVGDTDIVPLVLAPGIEYDPDGDDEAPFEAIEDIEAVEVVSENGPVLVFPPVGLADDRVGDVEPPAAVKEPLALGKLELKLGAVTLLIEVMTRELVVLPTGVTLELVSDTADTLLLDAGAVENTIPELDEG